MLASLSWSAASLSVPDGSSLTTDSDGPPCAAGKPGGRGPPVCYPGSHNWRARAANLVSDD